MQTLWRREAADRFRMKNYTRGINHLLKMGDGETDPDDISCVLFDKIFFTHLLKSKRCKFLPFQSSKLDVLLTAVVLDYIFCWRIL